MRDKNTLYKELSGQALIEYALILVLVGIAFGFALAATGPAIGNVFSNIVYNLLGQTPDVREVNRPGDFWLTVTWVADNPVQERPLPTRTSAPPSSTPTPGPSPTITPVTPTRTREPTSTPSATPTPGDFEFIAPEIFRVNNPEYWRVGAQPFLGTDDWVGQYFVNNTDSSSANHSYSNRSTLDWTGASPQTIKNRELGAEYEGVLDFNWGNTGPIQDWPANSPYDHYSVRYSRNIYIDSASSAPITLTFSATYNDGLRLWLLESGETAGNSSLASCSATGVRSGMPNNGVVNQTYGDPSTDCLLIDDWEEQAGGSSIVTRTIDTNKTYTLQVDYFEGTGNAGLKLNIGMSPNVDDTEVDDTGSVRAGTVGNCVWTQYTNDDSANSLQFMWKDYPGDTDGFPRNTRCHLELRGFVHVPGLGEANAMSKPEFVYWDIWDFQSSSLSGWLEVSEYHKDLNIIGKADRTQFNWIRVNQFNGATRNYNWTRHVVDLTDVRGDGTTTTDDNFIGEDVTFRFVIQNTVGANEIRRWFIDDVEFREGDARDFRPGTLLKLNDELTDRPQFVTSGQWDLTAEKSLPDFEGVISGSNPDSCCSWELRPKGPYSTFYTGGSDIDYGDGQGSDPFGRNRQRIHYVELNGYVDVNDTFLDDEGDSGEPLLSFYHAYDLGQYSGMEIQYTDDPYGTRNENWRVVPALNSNNPAPGLLRPHTATGNFIQKTLTNYEISLAGVVDSSNNVLKRFRLRFALIVNTNANVRLGKTGWWIDEIYLHRAGAPKFLDYPFYDSAEIGVDNWLTSGRWYRDTTYKRTGNHAFTDSPLGDYLSGESYLRTIYPIDLNNDTPANLALTDRNDGSGSGGCVAPPNPGDGGNCGGAAVDPVLTFWHNRHLGANDQIVVEWRRMRDPDTSWNTLWIYAFDMTTKARAQEPETRQNLAMEYVEVDLTPLRNTFSGDASDVEDDDVLFRFRLVVNSSGNDGVYVDDIEVKERPAEAVHKLWPSIETRTVNSINFGNGNSTRFTADGEDPFWFEKWRMGGTWEAILWNQRNGLRAFHESAENATTKQNVIRPLGPYVKTIHNTFSVLDIVPIIDLRATNIIEKPTLYFWSHYDIGQGDKVMVQISHDLELDAANIETNIDQRCSGLGPQCYEQTRGWSEWQYINASGAASENAWRKNENARTYTWQRWQVDLSGYASPDNSTPGKRIRIRFVVDGYRHDNNADGFYVDNVLVGPRQDEVIRSIASNAFFDPARNMNNWVPEGYWGLSPELNRGGSGPATLGTWQETWWHCGTACDPLSSSGRFRNDVDVFLDSGGTAVTVPSVSRQVLDINYDFGYGAPRPGFFDFTNDIVGQWTLDTPVIGPTTGVTSGDYSFITISDEGVRLKYEILNSDGTTTAVDPTTGQPGAPPLGDSQEWNVIYNWLDHGRTADIGSMHLADGNRYRITLQFFEESGKGTIILTSGGSSFSFTDRPKQGAGAAFPDIGPMPRSNSSLILNGTLDLTGTATPVLQYYTYYEKYSTDNINLRTEVSKDGGFTWSTSGLGKDLVLPSGVTLRMDGPRISGAGDWMPYHGPWRERNHNLTNFIDEQIMIRFRFDNQNSDSIDKNGDSNDTYVTGWWIVDVQVAASS